MVKTLVSFGDQLVSWWSVPGGDCITNLSVTDVHCSATCHVCWSLEDCHLYTVSILGFENCQSFFSATAHVRCTAPARPTPRGRCRSAYSIFYWQNDTAIVISLQHASNCIQNTILSLVYIKLVVYYNKRSRKSRGIADLKRNP